jgi:hypothetical protein
VTTRRRVVSSLVLGALALSCASPARGPQARLAVEVLAGLPRVPAWEAAAPSRVELLIDVRPSVTYRRVGRAAALDAVRASASQLLGALPTDTPVTLHALGAGRGASCEAASALADPLYGTAGEIAPAVMRAAPRTGASLADGLRRVADTIARERRGPGARVVAISDLAPECGGDPCEAARALVATGATLELVAIGEAPAPECIAALAAPASPPAAFADVVPLTAPRFRATPARPGARPGAPVEGVAGGEAIELPAGVARVDVALEPPLVVPELALVGGALHRLRILDFPSASPPVREWTLETEAAAEEEASSPIDEPDARDAIEPSPGETSPEAVGIP